MKKISKILAICLAFVLVFALAACSNGAAPDPDSVKGEKVNAEAFAKAFDFSDVTNATLKRAESVKHGDEEYSSDAVIMMDGDKYYQTATITSGKNEDGTPKTETHEGYLAKEGDTYYEYEKDEEDGKWYKVASKMTEGVNASEYLKKYSATLIAAYAVLEYNEEKKAYVYSAGTDFTLPGVDSMEMEVKIVDGKVAVLKVVSGESTIIMQCYNIGSTSVSLPSAELKSEDAE